jgi:hypothetical protein
MSIDTITHNYTKAICFLYDDAGWQEERDDSDDDKNRIFNLSIDLKVVVTSK